MVEKIHLVATLPPASANRRIDQVLASLFPQYSRARLQQWIKANAITINGLLCTPKSKVIGGEEIEIHAELPAENNWEAEAIALDIIYEDDDLIIVNKPVGLVTHPAAGNPSHTLVNALLHHAPQLQQLPRAGIIHRLDKNTSGLLLVAKSLTAYTQLVRAMQARDIHREYEGIVNGVLISGGTIDAPIGRHPVDRKRMAVVHNGKMARTHYRVIERYRMHTHIKIELETGRTHQIRVHMSHIRHPLLGDTTYGARLLFPKQADPALCEVLQQFNHQALHACRLTLAHPILHTPLECIAPLPEAMQQLINLLQADTKV